MTRYQTMKKGLGLFAEIDILGSLVKHILKMRASSGQHLGQWLDYSVIRIINSNSALERKSCQEFKVLKNSSRLRNRFILLPAHLSLAT